LESFPKNGVAPIALFPHPKEYAPTVAGPLRAMLELYIHDGKLIGRPPMKAIQ